MQWLRAGLVAGALLSPLPGARAADFVVAGTGDDTAAGSSAHPWQTLQHAADVVTPGDQITVRAGTFAGFALRRGGTADAGIVFRGSPGTVLTTPATGTPSCIHLEDAGFVTIEGFTLRACPHGLHAYGSPHAVVRDNLVEDVAGVGITISGGADVVVEGNRVRHVTNGVTTWNSDRVVLRGNEVSDTDQDAVLLFGELQATGGALVEQNLIHDVDLVGGGSALGLDGVQDSVLRDNLLYGCHSAGIVLYQIDGLRPSTGNLVINNTILVAADGRWALGLKDGAVRTVALNNILLDANPLAGAMTVDVASLGSLRSDFNVVTEALTPDNGATVLALSAWRAATGQDTSSQAVSDPWFVDQARADFHLRRGSPAIDRGTSELAPRVDLDGFARPVGAGVDVGAYEFCGGEDCVVPVDAGPVDAGATTPRTERYQVGCGCGATDATGPGALLLAWVLGGRRGRKTQQNQA